MLIPPLMSKEQSAVAEALTKTVGKNIRLKYPKSGTYRSAVTIADIDADSSPEAIVFYEFTDVNIADGSVRMNILDGSSTGEWTSIYDNAGPGRDIDRLIISSIGDSAAPVIAIGFILLSGIKTARIFSYGDRLTSADFTAEYASMFIADLDKNAQNELCIIRGNTVETDANLSLLSIRGGTIYEQYSVPLNPDATEFVNIASGNVAKNTPALFIDSLTEGELFTDIVYFNGQTMRNPMYLERSNLIASTRRPSGYLSADIDLDSIIEIPTLSLFPGYTSASIEPEYCVNWNILSNFSITKKIGSFYSPERGFAFLFPTRWDGIVTVKNDPLTNETVFLRYAAIPDEQNELMRIAVTPVSENLTSDGYIEAAKKDNFAYWVKIGEVDDALILTQTEISHNFYVL
jgi:hypothetical protein